MAVASIFVYCGEGGYSIDDVNRLSDSLSKNRQWVSHDGIRLCDLYCVTNKLPGLFYDQVKILKCNNDYEGFWNIIQCYEEGFRQTHAEDKVIVLNHPTIMQDLIGIPMLESTPERGKTENAAKSISEEDKEMVKEQRLYPVQQFDNWWSGATEMSPFWLACAGTTAQFIYNEFKDNFEQISEDYDADPYGFQQWVECELEDKLFYLNHAHGVNIPYHLNNKNVQLHRNELWEQNVRPWFDSELDGYGWRGLGGDQEAELFEYDHEYRAISRQCSFITFEGDTDKCLEDEYARWWIL